MTPLPFTYFYYHYYELNINTTWTNVIIILFSIKIKFPLSNKCLIKNVIYKATVTSNKEIKEYIGSTGNTFKSRWYNHNHSFNTYKENSTELAKYIWFLKNNNINYNIKWNIIHHIGEVRSIHNICSTCSLEKLEIAKANRRNNLNKRYELFANCPHFKKLYFKT